MNSRAIAISLSLSAAFLGLHGEAMGQNTVRENTGTFNMCQFIDRDTVYLTDLASNIFTRQGLNIRVLHNGAADTNNTVEFPKHILYQNHTEYWAFTSTYQYDSLPPITLVQYSSPVADDYFNEVKPSDLRDYVKIGNQEFIFDMLLYHSLHTRKETINASIDSSYLVSLNKRKYLVIFIHHNHNYSSRLREFLACVFDITDVNNIKAACLGLTSCTTMNMFGCYDGKYLDFLKIDLPNYHDFQFASRHGHYPLDTIYWYRFDRGQTKKIKDKYLVVQSFSVGDGFPCKIICDKSRWFDLRKYKNR